MSRLFFASALVSLTANVNPVNAGAYWFSRWNPCEDDPEPVTTTTTTTTTLPPTRSVRILTWNIWMMPGPLSWQVDVAPKRTERVDAIAKYITENISDLDVIAFVEAFDDDAMKRMSERLKPHGFKYQTHPVYYRHNKFSPHALINSGVMYYSKYPIVAEKMWYFHGPDREYYERLASKGGLYVKINKAGLNLNIVNTHMASFSAKPRAYQMTNLYQFAEMQNIPKTEPLFFAGDMNVNKFADKEASGNQANPGAVSDSEYDLMLSEFNSTDFGTVSQSASHAKSCQWMGENCASTSTSKDGSAAELDKHLDYVLVAKGYLQPKSNAELAKSGNKNIVKTLSGEAQNSGIYYQCDKGPRFEIVDLSDHKPVLGEFYF